MKIQKSNALAHGLHDFFIDYLPRLRGMSPNTIRNYRDCLILLLRYVADNRQRAITDLDIDDLNVEQIIRFLQMLEDNRGNTITTRNIRLAAIHVFFRYLVGNNPEKMEHCQKILAVPFKRANSRIVEYFEYDEIQAVFSAVDQSYEDGARDYVLLVTMFNTGARVQEILDLRLCDLQLIKPYQVRLMGKGRKERLCPLWPQTAELLKELIATRNTQPEHRVFLNHRKQPLTRFGVRYLLKKYCNIAKKVKSSLAGKRLHPHSMRHSTAVHLLKSGVDIVTISQWLGHASINTTNRYASVDLDMKRDAISKAAMDINPAPSVSWHSNASILTWLESL